MNRERKQLLLNYLFPNEEMRKFMCNDLYIELEEILPSKICISPTNISSIRRKENYSIAYGSILAFLTARNDYCEKVAYFYKDKELDFIINEIIIGYVFYLSSTRKRNEQFDIFKNKKSICYSPISLIDML